MADPQKRKIDPDQIVHDRNAVLRAIRSVRKRCNLNAGIIALSRWLFWGLSSALVVDVGLKVFGIGGWSWILVGGGSALGWWLRLLSSTGGGLPSKWRPFVPMKSCGLKRGCPRLLN